MNERGLLDLAGRPRRAQEAVRDGEAVPCDKPAVAVRPVIAWLLSLWLRLDTWICGTDCDPLYDPEHPDEETW